MMKTFLRSRRIIVDNDFETIFDPAVHLVKDKINLILKERGKSNED